MDAHTARCLQLSTSIRVHPYRQYRVPEHINRSRFPVNVMPQQPQTVPATTAPKQTWVATPPTKPTVRTSFLPALTSQNTFAQHQSIPSLSSASALEPAEVQSSYLPVCLTPEDVDPSVLWDEAFDFANSTMDFSGFGDLDLAFGNTGTEFVQGSTNLKITNTDPFAYPSSLSDFDPLSFTPGSPDGQSLSSVSESSGGFLSDFPDFSDMSPESELACFNLETSANISTNLDTFMPLEDPAPKLAIDGFSRRPGRSITESSPRDRYRTSPYPVTARGRSVSAGSVALPRNRGGASYIRRAHKSLNFASQLASPAMESANMQGFNNVDFEIYCQSQTTPMPTSQFDDSSMFLPFSFDQPIRETESVSLPNSPETVNVLQSSSTTISHCEHHFAGSSEPPDLFGPLARDQLSPPSEDMQCKDHDAPRAQELRFEGDLYTPKYVRGHGNKREGWCGICKPGRWLVLKNSAFWYDKSFTHGISAATGTAFEGPTETRRMKGNPDVWEGLCSSCGDWIALISSKKKGTTWFRHAYKCHTHQRVKDTPKRRREVTHARTKKISKAAEIKPESRDDSPYLLDSPLMSLDEEMELQDGDFSSVQTESSATT